MRNVIILLSLLTLNAWAGSPQAVFSQSQVTAGNTSAIALAANANRGYLLIQNQGDANCYVKFGAAIGSGNDGVLIAAAQYYEPYIAPKTAVYMKCASINQTIQFVEGNY